MGVIATASDTKSKGGSKRRRLTVLQTLGTIALGLLRLTEGATTGTDTGTAIVQPPLVPVTTAYRLDQAVQGFDVRGDAHGKVVAEGPPLSRAQKRAAKRAKAARADTRERTGDAFEEFHTGSNFLLWTKPTCRPGR